MGRVKLYLIFVKVIDFGDTEELQIGLLRNLLFTHLEDTIQVGQVYDPEDSIGDPFEPRENHLECIKALQAFPSWTHQILGYLDVDKLSFSSTNDELLLRPVEVELELKVR